MWPALIVAAGTMAASYLNKPKDARTPLLKQAMADIASINTPDPEALKVKLAQYVQQGILTPEDAQAFTVNVNAYDQANGNAQAQGAQLEALQQLQDQISQGGLTDTSRASIQAALDTVNNNQRGQDLAITEDAHRRGVSGSGLEMASRLMSQQNASDQAGRQGMDIAALAEQAKMAALKEAGQLGGQIESQTFQEQSAKAAAQNAINQYNSTNQQQVALQNVAARNAAQAANLAQKQQTADQNTSSENANRVRNADLIRQSYMDRMDKAKAMANAAAGVGQSAQAASDANTKWTGEMIGGATNAFSTYGANMGGSGATNPNVMSLGNGNTTLTGTERDKYKPYLAAKGGRVPGDAMYPGDDPRNDTVDAKLSPGETVVPRSQSDEYENFMDEMPRSAGRPSVDSVKLVLQALSEMAGVS